MPKSPEFRIIGGGSEEEKEATKKELENKFLNRLDTLDPESRKKLKEIEIEKSEKVKTGIDFANQETNELRKELGLETFDVPPDNYIILPRELFKKAPGVDNASASTFYKEQFVVLDGDYFGDRDLQIAKTILHETFHLKAQFTMEVSEKGKKTPYREGVSIKATQKSFEEQGYHEHFRGLHEAIVSTQEKKSFPKLLALPQFAEERKWLESDEAQNIRREIAERERLMPDEITWVDPKNKEGGRWFAFSYERPRKVLKYICEQIQEQFNDKYKSSDEVFREFLKANFTGQLLNIARLVETTFGKGSFRLLGNMETGDANANVHLEHFRKNRGRQTEKK